MTRLSTKSALLASAALLAAGGAAHAQQFSFETNKILGSPGEVIEIPVFVSGAPVPVGGVNFTLRVSGDDLVDVRLGEATTATGLGAGFEFAYNADIARSGVATGAITGDVHEFRGVIYGTGPVAPSFAAATPVQVASVFVQLGPYSKGTYSVELAVDSDGEIALGGISDVDGGSLPGGGIRPGGDVVEVDVTDGTNDITTDFTDSRDRENWVYEGTAYEGLLASDNPALAPIGDSNDTQGLVITSVAEQSFGSWGYDWVNIGSMRNPAPGLLHMIEWDLAASADKGDSPTPRLRHLTANFFQGSELAVIDFTGFLGIIEDDGIDVVPGTGGLTYNSILEIPAFAADGVGFDGVNAFMDLLVFGFGKVGESLWMSQMRERFVDPASLGAGQIVYDQVFSASNAGTFLQAAVDQGGRTVQYIQDARGIGVRSGGADVFGAQQFSLGTWFTVPDSTGVVFDASKLYKVEIEVSGSDDTDGVFDPFWMPQIRLRLYTSNLEYSKNFNTNPTSIADPAVSLFPVSPATVTYTFWKKPIPAIDGLAMNFGFDVIDLITNPNGQDEDVSVHLKSLRITAYDAP